MTTTLQPQLKLNDPRYRRPTMTVAAAKGVLDCNEDEIVEKIGEGLLPCWDIGSPGADRLERRILTRGIALAVRLEGNESMRPVWRWQEILPLLLPLHGKPWILGTDFQRTFNCGSTHVINLVESKVLQIMPGTTWKRGPGGSPSIQRDSFEQFLRGRLEVATNIRGLL